MRIVFMGTPMFAVPSLQRLIDSHHEVVMVVTQADKPSGRGQVVKAPPVKLLAAEHGIEVAQPTRLRDEGFIAKLAEAKPDVIVVVAYGKILPQTILDLPRLGCINVHASLLPKYRGAAPINWAIINGETESGVTIMKMDAGMDTGDIIVSEKVEILEDDDVTSLADMLSVVGAAKLTDVLDETEQSGEISAIPQEHSLATSAPMLKKSDGLIDWTRRTDEIIWLVRGTHPWPGAYTPSPHGILKILRAEMLWPDAVLSIAAPAMLKPGTVSLLLKSHGFAVKTGDGFVLVTEAQPEGKRAMSGVDMVNGQYVKKGDRLVGGQELPDDSSRESFSQRGREET